MQILCSYHSFFRVHGSREGHNWERCSPKIRFLTSFCSSSFLYSSIPWKSFSFRGMLTGRIGSSMICPGDVFSIWPTLERAWKEIKFSSETNTYQRHFCNIPKESPGFSRTRKRILRAKLRKLIDWEKGGLVSKGKGAGGVGSKAKAITQDKPPRELMSSQSQTTAPLCAKHPPVVPAIRKCSIWNIPLASLGQLSWLCAHMLSHLSLLRGQSWGKGNLDTVQLFQQ